MKEKSALYWRKKEESSLEKHTSIECLLCPHNCILKEGQSGICRVRINRGDRLVTLAWGNPCSICIDPIEKKPLKHFMSGTKTLSLAIAGCNMRCLNCQNSIISQSSPNQLPNYSYTPEQIVELAIEHQTPSISFTYTEPTIYYEYMLETAKVAQSKSIKTVLVSNGYINREPLYELSEWIDAANIDLKCFHPALHLKLTGAKLQPVLDTLQFLKERGVYLEITHLMVPNYSDNLEIFTNMCRWLVEKGFSDTPLHINRFISNYQLIHLPATPLHILMEANKIATKSGIKNIYLGNI